MLQLNVLDRYRKQRGRREQVIKNSYTMSLLVREIWMVLLKSLDDTLSAKATTTRLIWR